MIRNKFISCILFTLLSVLPALAQKYTPQQDPGSKLWGVADNKGKWKVQPTFEEVKAFTDPLAISKKGDHYGVINLKKGKEVVECSYKHLLTNAEMIILLNDDKDFRKYEIVMILSKDAGQSYTLTLTSLEADKGEYRLEGSYVKNDFWNKLDKALGTTETQKPTNVNLKKFQIAVNDVWTTINWAKIDDIVDNVPYHEYSKYITGNHSYGLVNRNGKYVVYDIEKNVDVALTTKVEERSVQCATGLFSGYALNIDGKWDYMDDSGYIHKQAADLSEIDSLIVQLHPAPKKSGIYQGSNGKYGYLKEDQIILPYKYDKMDYLGLIGNEDYSRLVISSDGGRTYGLYDIEQNKMVIQPGRYAEIRLVYGLIWAFTPGLEHKFSNTIKQNPAKLQKMAVYSYSGKLLVPAENHYFHYNPWSGQNNYFLVFKILPNYTTLARVYSKNGKLVYTTNWSKLTQKQQEGLLWDLLQENF